MFPLEEPFPVSTWAALSVGESGHRGTAEYLAQWALVCADALAILEPLGVSPDARALFQLLYSIILERRVPLSLWPAPDLDSGTEPQNLDLWDLVGAEGEEEDPLLVQASSSSSLDEAVSGAHVSPLTTTSQLTRSC